MHSFWTSEIKEVQEEETVGILME